MAQNQHPRPTRLIRASLLLILALTACSIPAEPSPTAEGIPPAEEPAAVNEEPAPEGQPATEAPTPGGESPPAEPLPQGQPLPDGPITLVTLGDSLTEGTGDYDRGDGYPGRLIEMLQATRPGSSVFNYGISGWNTDMLIHGEGDLPSQLQQGLADIRRARDAGEPAIALVWIGSNDLWYLYEYGPDPITEEAETYDLENYTRNLTQIVSELHNAGAAVILGLMDDQALRPAVANPASEPVLPYTTPDDLQRMSIQLQAYNAVILDLAAQFGAGVVDFYHTDLFTNPDTLADDGIHPNAYGYEVIAGMWLEAIQALLP